MTCSRCNTAANTARLAMEVSLAEQPLDTVHGMSCIPDFLSPVLDLDHQLGDRGGWMPSVDLAPVLLRLLTENNRLQ